MTEIVNTSTKQSEVIIDVFYAQLSNGERLLDTIFNKPLLAN